MTKPCPNCGNEINELAIGCPSCGAKWSEDGEYLGVPSGSTGAVDISLDDVPVTQMSVSTLRSVIFWSVFWAVLAAGFFWLFLTFALQVIIEN